MTACIRCNGIGWIQKTVSVPAKVYGKATTATVAKPCPNCHTPQPTYFDGKAAAAGD